MAAVSIVRALVEDPRRGVEQRRGRVEPPGPHGVADRPRQLPVPGRGDHRVVASAGGLPRVEQRQVGRAGHPGPPQVVERAATRARRAGRAARASPAHRRPSPGAVGLGRRRTAGGWYAPTCAGRVRPDRPEPVGAGALGDRPGQRQGGRVGVVLGGARLAPDGAPALSGILAASSAGVSASPLALTLSCGRDRQAVVRGERLVRPAIGQQAAVEPGVGGLVEDHEVVGVVGDLDRALARIEQPGVATGRPADRLLDGQAAGPRPGQADLVGQHRQRAAHQVADPGGPRRVVRPRPDREADPASRRPPATRSVRCRRPAGRRRDRRRRHSGRSSLPVWKIVRPVGVHDRRGDRARLDLDLEAGREDDLDRAPGRAVGGERPDRERHERVADPDVAGRRATRVDEVEDQPVAGGLAAEQALAEVQPEERVVLRPLSRRGLPACPCRSQVSLNPDVSGRTARKALSK